MQLFVTPQPQRPIAFLPLGPIALKSRKKKPYRDPPETLGEHLRKKRMLDGSLQKEIAARLGINQSTYLLWEHDRAKPAVRFIPRAIEFLGYNPFPIPKTLGEQIRAKRSCLGLSQKKLAKLLGVDEETLRRYERGEWVPKGDRLGRFARLLGSTRPE